MIYKRIHQMGKRWTSSPAQHWVFALTLSMGVLSAGGCGVAPAESRVYPVLWNVDLPDEPAICIQARNEYSFRHATMPGVLRVPGSIHISLLIVNRTGNDIFLADLTESCRDWVKWRLRGAEEGSTLWQERIVGRGMVGCGMPFELLFAETPEDRSGPIRRQTFTTLNFDVFVYDREGAERADLEISIGLRYYVLGAEEPVEMTVVRSMRVLLADDERWGVKKPVKPESGERPKQAGSEEHP